MKVMSQLAMGCKDKREQKLPSCSIDTKASGVFTF